MKTKSKTWKGKIKPSDMPRAAGTICGEKDKCTCPRSRGKKVKEPQLWPKLSEKQQLYILYAFGLWVFIGGIIKASETDDVTYLIAPAFIAIFLLGDLAAKYFGNK